MAYTGTKKYKFEMQAEPGLTGKEPNPIKRKRKEKELYRGRKKYPPRAQERKGRK